jgi:plastocyanin
MAKIFLIVTLIVSLVISCALAVDMPIKVGAGGKNAFDPKTITAAPGDTLTFTWESGKHSVFQADSLTACAKSSSLSISQAATDVVGTKYVYTIPATATGKNVVLL